MGAAERVRNGIRVRRHVVTLALLAFLAPLCWLTLVGSTPAQAQSSRLMTTGRHLRPAEASTPTTIPDSGHASQGQEGPVAKVASVIGIIVVVTCIVGLGSISVRRRTRDRPSAGGAAQRGPPGRERGPFDEWFRPRR
jgi:type IV secretory pathway VirB2 component (pilin)